MKDNVLEVRNLEKNYHDIKDEIKAIDKISFNIKDKEIVSIVGPSGCGKSTILNILAEIENKSGGIIDKNNKKIGYMLQKDSLFEWKTVYENAILGLKIKKILNNDNIKNVNELLLKYGLNEFKSKYPSSLSGGMRQKVALIRTLAINPDILLLDEPFSALDYQTRLVLSDDLYNIIKQENKTAIIVTHDIGEAISISDRVIVLTKRPAKIKNIYNINLNKKTTPRENRKDEKFNYYYNLIWKDLDKND